MVLPAPYGVVQDAYASHLGWICQITDRLEDSEVLGAETMMKMDIGPNFPLIDLEYGVRSSL